MEENNIANIIELLSADDLAKFHDNLRTFKGSIYNNAAKEELDVILDAISEKINNIE